jgi:hypothetical protein
LDVLFRRNKLGTTNQQAIEMMQKLMQKKTKPASKPMPMRGERTAKNKQKKDKK